MASSRDWSNLTLSEMTWSERAQAAIAFTLACVIGLGMFLGVLFVVGESLDGIARHKSEHNRCMQKATNGYEIERC